MSMNISAATNSPLQSTMAFEPTVAPPQPSENSKTIADAATQSMQLSQIQSLSSLRQAEVRGEKHAISDEQVVKAVERAIKAMQGKTTSLEFNIHEKTRLIAIKVLDKDTGEVIREIPPEKTLDFVAKLWEMAGLFVDEKR